MNRAAERAVEAAGRVLQLQARQSSLDRVELERAAWLIGQAGLRVPQFADPALDRYIRLAAALGAGDKNTAEFLLTASQSPASDDWLLFDACYLAGPVMADRLIEIAYRTPGRQFAGKMLASAAHPERLLALLGNRAVPENAIMTIGELVITGRDAGKPVVEAEARWSALMRDLKRNKHSSGFQNAWLRITVRESLEKGVDLLRELEYGWGRDPLDDGADAVLARLVRQDPEHAVQIVMNNEDPYNRLAWLDALVWWFELPAPAERLVQELLLPGDPDVNAGLAQILTMAQAPHWLDLALGTAHTQPPLDLARDLAPGVCQLRAGRLDDEAERVRNQILPFLPELSPKQEEVSARDLFDISSAPGLPVTEPWGAGPGLP